MYKKGEILASSSADTFNTMYYSLMKVVQGGSSADTLDIVSGQHPSHSGALDGAGHPSFVNGGAVDDQVTVPEAHLVRVSCLVVIHCTVATLQ